MRLMNPKTWERRRRAGGTDNARGMNLALRCAGERGAGAAARRCYPLFIRNLNA